MNDDEQHQRSEARAVLQRYWGHADFRPGQAEAIEAVLEGRDAFVVLPTGGGKSVCYQVPALLKEGFVLVVSPLIALMQDQVAGLKARGVSAAYINSTLAPRAIEQRWTNAEFGQYDLIYVAPERFESDLFQARAERLRVALLAVDEAHCVSEWGHHFRPAYLQIPKARALLGDPPTLAVTATATPPVRRDVIRHLALRDPVQIAQGFDRPNLVWSVFRVDNKRGKAHDVLRGVPGSGIVYAATRRGVEQWAGWLQRQGETAAHYHGGLSAQDREAAQQRWLQGEVRLMVATNAFGMGIDKPDVRFVLHVDPPASVEAYYQEAGRAGRDGRRAHAVLLFQENDAETQQALIASSHPSAQDVQAVYDAVCNVGQVPLGTAPDGPIAINYEAVQKLTGFWRGKIDTAAELLERQEAWHVLPVRRHYGLVRFAQSPGVLRRHADGLANAALADFVRTLLRGVHAEAFSDWWPLDLRALMQRTGLERSRLLRGLDFLQARGLLDWRPPGQSTQVELAVPRARRFPMDGRAVRRAKDRAEARLDDLLHYARLRGCRRHFLLAYFGETSPPRCGACDVCLGRHEEAEAAVTSEDEPALRRLLEAARHGAPREAWAVAAGVSQRETDRLAEWLVQEGLLRLEAPLEARYALTDKADAFLSDPSAPDASAVDHSEAARSSMAARP